MMYEVEVSKEYHNTRDGTKTVYGVIEIEADNQREAEDHVILLMKTAPVLQTIDPRISWEEDYEDLNEQGWEYTDWTFVVERSNLPDLPDLPESCECDNTHQANDTVCRWCWAQGRRKWSDPDVDA